jgi:transmembrane sensor
MDWDAFTAWLEADPHHRLAFDEIAAIDRRLEDRAAWAADDIHAGGKPAANDSGQSIGIARSARVRWGWAGAGGVAAAALALVLLVGPGQRRLPVHDYRSQPGQTVEVRLGGRSEAVLAPASELTVEGNRLAIRGSAYFDVDHRPGRALSITAGGFEVTDIGTRFSVSNEPDGLRVEVAEGVVSVSSSELARPISLTAGHGLVADRSEGTVRLISLEPQQVASWRTGRLQFDGAPLALVARQISRYSGKPVTVDPAIADKRFSGVIAINDGEAPARTLAEILSLEVRKVDGALRLEPRKS